MIPTSKYGLYKHPNQPVIVPSNNITMEGINHPVLALPDNDEPTMMYPNQNYQFNNSSKTLEIPMMKYYQEGGQNLQSSVPMQVLKDYVARLPEDQQQAFMEKFQALSPEEQAQVVKTIMSQNNQQQPNDYPTMRMGGYYQQGGNTFPARNAQDYEMQLVAGQMRNAANLTNNPLSNLVANTTTTNVADQSVVPVQQPTRVVPVPVAQPTKTPNRTALNKVAQAQAILNRQGYLDAKGNQKGGDWDGIWGIRTEAAFQKAKVEQERRSGNKLSDKEFLSVLGLDQSARTASSSYSKPKLKIVAKPDYSNLQENVAPEVTLSRSTKPNTDSLFVKDSFVQRESTGVNRNLQIPTAGRFKPLTDDGKFIMIQNTDTGEIWYQNKKTGNYFKQQ